MLKDFRESFAANLRDPEFQRELVTVAYEEEGPEGVLRALREIAAAEDTPSAYALTGQSPKDSGFQAVRDALNALDLDFAIVRKA